MIQIKLFESEIGLLLFCFIQGIMDFHVSACRALAGRASESTGPAARIGATRTARLGRRDSDRDGVTRTACLGQKDSDGMTTATTARRRDSDGATA